MGGIFSAPSPPPPPEPLPTPPDPQEEVRKQRLETIARNRRGRAGLVATSMNGALQTDGGQAKRLLGE